MSIAKINALLQALARLQAAGLISREQLAAALPLGGDLSTYPVEVYAQEQVYNMLEGLLFRSLRKCRN
jgi:hypothetical protein